MNSPRTPGPPPSRDGPAGTGPDTGPRTRPDTGSGVPHHELAADELAAFDAVFCTHLHKLYRRAAMLVGSRQWAEDAVHEAYLKLARRPQNFLGHPEPYAYAFATLVSVVRDAWRRERRQVLVPDLEPSAGSAQAWDGGVERRSAELDAVRLLGRLSVRQAGVVILVDLDGYTIDQAAGILRVHRGTVARTRSRALNKLRGELGGQGERVGEEQARHRRHQERHEC